MPRVHLPNGSRVRTFTLPPAGFDPLKAESAALALHGAPPRPVGNPKLLARWESAMGRITQIVEPSFRTVNRRLIQPETKRKGPVVRAAITPVTPGQSGWGICGAELPTPNNPITWASGEFTVPSVVDLTTGPGQNSGCIFAVSLDRFGQTDFPLIAGVIYSTQFIQQGDSGSWVPVYQAFWAMGYELPFNILTNQNGVPYPVNVGDVVSVVVSYGLYTDSEVYFALSGNGWGTAFSVPLPQGGFFTGQDAAWTVETWVDDGAVSIVPNFGTIYFSEAGAVVSCGSNGFGAPYYPNSGNATSWGPPLYGVNYVDNANANEVICSFIG